MTEEIKKEISIKEEIEESIAKKLNNKFVKAMIIEADSIDFKTKITKEKEKVDKYADSANLDQYEDETGDKVVYADDKGNIIGAYDKKKKKFYTNASKEEVDRVIIEADDGSWKGNIIEKRNRKG